MIRRMPTHCGDSTCPSCVVAGDYIFLSHHAGGHDSGDVAYQMRSSFESMRKTLASVDARLEDLVQVNLYLRDMKDFPVAVDVFREYLSGMPARTTVITEFVTPACLCQIDGVAYKPEKHKIARRK